MSMMIINEFALEGREGRPAGGLGDGGGPQGEGGQPARAGPGPGQSPPQPAGGLPAGSVPRLSPPHHVLEVRLAPS